MNISEEIKELETYIKTLPSKKAALLPALEIFQRERGFIADRAIEEIARLLELSPTEVLEVASFYHFVFRRPMGKVIRLCQNISCSMAGGDELFKFIEARLGIKDGETTGDGRFSLIGTACLGRCDGAPAIMINDSVCRNAADDTVERCLSLSS